MVWKHTCQRDKSNGGESLEISLEQIKITSCNCRGLHSTYYRPDLHELINEFDILFSHETWFSKQNLDNINGLCNETHGNGTSTPDYRDRLVQGYPSGCVGFLLNSKLDNGTKYINLDLEWRCGILISVNNKHTMILYVSMPYQSTENEYDNMNTNWKSWKQ